MKDSPNFVLKLILIVCVSCFVNMAAAQSEINHFSVGSNICTPVKVITSRGDSFYIYGGEKTVVGRISWVEAWDCEGRKILDLTPDKKWFRSKKPSEYWYVFTTLYPQEEKNSYYQRDKNSGNWGKVARTMSDIPIDGYPNVQLQAGISKMYGEFARIKYCGGGAGGGMIYGSVGKDVLFASEYKDRLLWDIGFGYYFTLSKNSDFSIGVSYGQTSQIRKQMMAVDATLSYYFGYSTRFGVFIGAGGGSTMPGGDDMNSEMAWDVNVGVAIKIWNK